MGAGTALSRLGVAMVASVALVLGLVTPSYADPVEAAGNPLDLSLVPPIESPAVEVPGSSVPAGSFDAPVESPDVEVAEREVGEALDDWDVESLEVVDRDEYSTTYEVAPGINVTELGSAPLNVELDGEWVDVSTDLEASGDGWVGEAHPLNPEFAESGGEDIFTVESGGLTVSTRLQGSEDVEGSSDAFWPWESPTELTYEDVLGSADLEYSLEAGGVKESLVLEEAPTRPAVYRWFLEGDGLSIDEADDGSFVLSDSAGEPRFVIPAPVMWDSSGVEGEREPALVMVDAEASRTETGWALTLRPDRDWLTDPDRVYPVTIDPTVSGWGPSWQKSWKSDGTVFNNSTHVGNTRQSNTNRYWRGFNQFPLNAIAGKVVVDVSLSMSYANGTTNCFGGAINLASVNPPSNYNHVGEYVSSYGGLCNGSATASYSGIELLDWRIAEWVRNGWWSAALVVRGDEGGVYSYKQVNTALYVAWVDRPWVSGVTSTTPANGAIGPKMPIMWATGGDPAGYGLNYRYEFSTTSNFSTIAFDSGWQPNAPYQVPALALQPATHYYYRISTSYPGQTILGTDTTTTATNAAWHFTTNTPAPSPAQGSSSPANGSVVTTLTPTLSTPSVTDVDGSPVEYQFRIATGSDGATGTVVTSGWLPSPSWTVPPGTLQNGGSYTWVVMTKDGVDNSIPPAWVSTMKVDVRLGTTGPSPFDSAGPVTVNLANGNVALAFASPTVNTLGGPMGLAFSYNSQQNPTLVRGLTGSYYNALNAGENSTSNFTFDGRSPLVVRTDAVPGTQWGEGSPAPAVGVNYFLARWTGQVTVPTAGDYTFGVVRDDGARVVVNTTTVFDQWNSNAAGLTWGSTIAMTTSPTPIRVDFYEATGGAGIELWVKGPGIASSGMLVPPDWFTTRVQTLPAGWSSSTPIAGGNAAYASARVTEGAIILTDVTGNIHTYTKVLSSAGGYIAPVGEYGILSLDASGQVVLTESDGTVYTFSPQGTIASVTSASDAFKPATPIITYRPNGLVDRISDPASLNVGSNPATYSREVRFAYAGDSGLSLGLSLDATANSACALVTGFAAPPPGMLCRIFYPGSNDPNTTTRLLYNSNGQLAGILDPGGERTDFGYDDKGRLSSIRDSLANDWIAAGKGTENDPLKTQITYTADGRAQTVTLPAPDGKLDPRPAKTFIYDLGNSTTYVDIAGLNMSTATATSGHAAKVTYNALWQQTSATSPMGLTSSKVWSVKDQLLSVTDPQGLMSTTIYNEQDRPTHSYGPAPVACYDSNRVPHTGANCPDIAPHSITAYDESLVGLHAAYYTNPYLQGRPATFSLGLQGVTGGAVDRDFGVGGPIVAPAGTIASDNFSIRLTGLIKFPSAGIYTIKTLADDYARVWIDDVLRVDGWGPCCALAGNSQISVTAGQTARIRVEYAEVSGGSSLKLQWVAPGSSTAVTIPGQYLTPDYGLANNVTVEDAAQPGSGLTDTQVPDLVTILGYDHPWLGAVTSTTIDPTGLQLKTATTYEAPGSGWLRRVTRAMPSNPLATTVAAGATVSAYWDDNPSTTNVDESALTAAICNVPAGTRQYGFTKSITTATSSSGSGIVTEYVYDLFGRTAGVRRTGDAGWSCVGYDPRGRVTQATFPESGSTRTVTTVYTVDSDPRKTLVTDSVLAAQTGTTGAVSSTTDLLGRTTKSTDVWGTITQPVFNVQTGQLISVTTTAPHGEWVKFRYQYDLNGVTDLDGKVEKIWLSRSGVTGETPVADPSYDPVTELLQSVAYVNGTELAGLTRNQAGAATGMTWSFPGASTAQPAVDIYATGYESGLDSWTAGEPDTVITAGTTTPHAGVGTLETSTTSALGGEISASRTVTGLTVGREYTATAWVNPDSATGVTDLRLGVAGVGTSTPVAPGVGFQQLSYQFTATATSNDLTLGYNAVDDAGSLLTWDDITLTQDAWVDVTVAATTVTDAVVRSQSGRIIRNILTDTASAAPETSTYTFDAAGRLTTAVIPRHTLTYGYGATTGCVNNAAGKNGNRTVSADAFDHDNNPSTPAVTTTVGYCYDNADRLTGTAVTNPVSGASPTNAAPGLSTTSSTPSLAYDAHGNTTRLADQTLFYDVADRHYKTVLDGGTTITYTLDAGGRMVQRTVTGSPGGVGDGTIRYLAGGAIADGSNAVKQWVLSLPGGVTLAIDTDDDSERWGYPNLHGDVIVTTDEHGTRVGARSVYDPFGQPIDPVTWNIGTATADDSIPNLLDGDADFGWVGRYGKYTEHYGSVATIEMGARQYVPALGRFLEVDPVEGGVTNAYDYPADPVNKLDLAGTMVCPDHCIKNKNGSGYTDLRPGQGPKTGLRPFPCLGQCGPKVASRQALPTLGCGAFICAPGGGSNHQSDKREEASNFGIEISYSVCGLVICLAVGTVIDEQLNLHPYLELTFGLRVSGGLQVGASTGSTSSSFEFVGGCEAAFGVGAYASGGYGISEGSPNSVGGSAAGGVTFGMGAGCSAGLGWTLW